jgi:DNA-binding MarR family transcriptional regulator
MTDFGEDDIARLRMSLAKISRQLDRQVSSDGMTRTQLSVLASVCSFGPIGASELAEREGLNPTMLSRILAKLEEGGLVERTMAEGDRRAIRVIATTAGARRQRQLRAERTKLLNNYLSSLSDDDSRLLHAALPALQSLADAMAAAGVRA